MASPTAQYSTCDICSIVKLKRMARMWRRLITRNEGGSRRLPSDVPPGHVAVLVGDASRRFVIRADYLNLPIFRQLLDQAYEEYGHEHHGGPLAIPCDEILFCDIVSKIEQKSVLTHFSCHVLGDSMSLLQGSIRRSAY